MFHWIAAAAVALAPAPPSAPPAPSMQAAFDAATKAWQEDRCDEAVPAFDALAATAPAKRNATLAAAIAVRRGRCLVKLRRADEAESSIRRGVDTLAGAGDSFKDEVREADQQLARLAMLRLDYDAGIVAAKQALALSTGVERIRPLVMLATLSRFDGDGVAVRATAEAMALMQTAPGVTKPQIAAVQVAAARALIAAGRIDEADALLKKALANNGGLTERTSLDDVSTRYDLAEVALLKKRLDDARLYLAYTGAGRGTDGPFAKAERLDVPQCGEVPGLTPDSSAVIEFSLDEDGTVPRVEPIYAQGGRDVALAFARAVRKWSWSPEVAKSTPAFYRLITRVELRCTRSAEGGDIALPLNMAAAAWFEEHGVAAPAEGAREADLRPRWQAAAAGSDPAALDANLHLARSPLTLWADKAAAASRAVMLAEALNAPQAIRTEAALAELNNQAIGTGARTWDSMVTKRSAAIRALLARPEVAADPLSAATLRLMIVELFSYDRKHVPTDTPQLLAAVANAPDLPEHHPLKVRALLSEADAAAARGDLASAATAFGRTGLSEQQCALIGVKPAVESSGVSSSLYPVTLMQMGFKGWVRVEYDIGADGKTASPRAVIAYPPFLFGDAAKTMIARTRYVRTYRPETSVACAANQQSIHFVLEE